jgi:hypothetical protein
MSLQAWAWACEHDWTSEHQIFFRIFCPCRHNIRRIFFDTQDKFFGSMKEYFSMSPWMNDIYGWKYGWKMYELYSECWQHMLFLWKIEQSKEGGNNLCQGFFQKQFDTWNAQVTLQSHISYFLNMKYIQALQHLNHIECLIKSHLPIKKYVLIQTLLVHHQEACAH